VSSALLLAWLAAFSARLAVSFDGRLVLSWRRSFRAVAVVLEPLLVAGEAVAQKMNTQPC
jgi:hypothetical protein